MFRVDVENILRQQANVYGTWNHYPNPLNRTQYEFNGFGSDEFQMFVYKIKLCPLHRTHDWTNCPYAHVGERARRRDPCQVPYMPVSCQEYRASGESCPRGEMCPFAHGVFEYWLHPAKYRTRMCNAGDKCTRDVCFFAHNIGELRVDPTNLNPQRGHHSLEEELEAILRMSSTTNVASNNSCMGRTLHTSVGLLGQTCMSCTANAATTSSGIGFRQESGVIGHRNMPNSLFLPPSSSVRTLETFGERPQELRLEFLESLRMLSIGDHYNNNNQVVQNNNIRTNGDLDVPNVDWVRDLLAG